MRSKDLSENSNLRDVQLGLKVLWDGHLARPDSDEQDAHPMVDQEL